MGISGTYESASQHRFIRSDFVRYLRQSHAIKYPNHARSVIEKKLRPYEPSEADIHKLEERLDKLILDYNNKGKEPDSVEKTKETLVKQTKQVVRTQQISTICHKSARKREQKKYNKCEEKNKKWGR